jgi:hypothetical protein
MAAALVRRSRVAPHAPSRPPGRDNAPNPHQRRNRVRRATAALAVLSLVAPGCAVRSWRPVTDAELESAGGQSVLVEGTPGRVELAGAVLAYPFLIGRPIAGSGPVYVDVEPDASVGVRGCDTERETGRVVRAPVRDASRLVGCDVQLETLRGPVALRVRGAFGAREVFGEPLACRDDHGRTRECTGLVRVDLRQYDRVDARRRDVPLSVAATVGAASLAALVVLYAAGVWALAHAE